MPINIHANITYNVYTFFMHATNNINKLHNSFIQQLSIIVYIIIVMHPIKWFKHFLKNYYSDIRSSNIFSLLVVRIIVDDNGG